MHADENYFGYTYGSETLPKGHWEIYQWATSRTGKADGGYHAVDLQTEIEHGFTDRLQGSFYLNAVKHDISQVSDFSDRDQFRFNGFQGLLKYSLRSPYKNGYGLAVYIEPDYKRYSAKSGDRENIFFLEPKLIMQKNSLEGTLILAANFSGEFEREHNLDAKEWESELELQFSAGLSYRFAPNWFAGVEALATSAFERMHLDALGEYGVFAGQTCTTRIKNGGRRLPCCPSSPAMASITSVASRCASGSRGYIGYPACFGQPFLSSIFGSAVKQEP